MALGFGYSAANLRDSVTNTNPAVGLNSRKKRVNDLLLSCQRPENMLRLVEMLIIPSIYTELLIGGKPEVGNHSR